MKIAIGYPPLESEKGIPFLAQNRQFQWGKAKWNAYPIVPAYAATMLNNAGHRVVWLDGIAEGWSERKWFSEIKKEKPDLIMMETKTPVVKRHWKIVNQLKIENLKLKIALVGDHVTALPEESFEKSKVDYILTGGDYDFLLLNLVNHLTKKEKLEPGIWYREKRRSTRYVIRNTGKFRLNHDLDTLPFIDRELTAWPLYAYKNSNYSRIPGTYTMFGRDCWWGKCTFCVSGDTQILTQEGIVPIEKIVEEKKSCKVLTAGLEYKKVIGWHKRFIEEKIKTILALYLPNELKITRNHKVYFLPKDSLAHCSKKCGWSYQCKPSRISKFLRCGECTKKHFLNYKINTAEAGSLGKGDFLAIPIDRSVRKINQINIEEVLKRQPTILKTQKKISPKIAEQIIRFNVQGRTERTISKTLGIDRETVHRYLLLAKGDMMETSVNHLSFNDNDEISFVGGHHKIPRFITIDTDFLFVAGLYIAEGHVSYHKNRPNSATIGLTFNKNETELINKTKLFFKKTFNIVLSETLSKKNNTCQLSISSTIVCKVFKTLFGDNCYDKKIPEDFTHLSIDLQRWLLRGLFEGDGHLRKERRKGGGTEYILETTSKMLAGQVFSMLLRFNAIPSYKIIQPRLDNEAEKHKITLFRQDIGKIFPDIELKNPSKITYKKGFILDDFALVPIIKIREEQFKGFVYNLTVKDNHSYTANFVVVKNCSWTTLYPGEHYRAMSPKRALDEIGHILDHYPVREIMDDSGTFPAGSWLHEFCQGMIKRGYHKKVKLDCNLRFNADLKEGDYQLMGRAGFRFVLFGLESANQKTLDRINKNLRVGQIEPNLKMAKKAGLWPHVTVMVGYPWENKKEVLETLNLTKRLFRKGLIDTLQATVVIPYPGTPLFNECQKKDWLKTLDWNRYDMKEPVMKTPMSNEEVMGLVKGIFSSFWSPEFFFRKLKEALTDGEKFRYYLFFAGRYFGKLLEFK